MSKLKIDPLGAAVLVLVQRPHRLGFHLAILVLFVLLAWLQMAVLVERRGNGLSAVC